MFHNWNFLKQNFGMFKNQYDFEKISAIFGKSNTLQLICLEYIKKNLLQIINVNFNGLKFPPYLPWKISNFLIEYLDDVECGIPEHLLKIFTHDKVSLNSVKIHGNKILNSSSMI